MVVSIAGINVRKPNYDTSPIGRGFDAIAQRRKEDEEKENYRRIGEKLSGADLRGAEALAYTMGDTKTGLALRRVIQSEDDREYQRGRDVRSDARQDAQDRRQATRDQREDERYREGRDEKERQYVANMMTTLNPNAPDFADKWRGHIGILRRNGRKIGPEYDDPATGYQLMLGEITGFGDRQQAEMRQQDQRLREQEIRIKQGEADSRSLSRNRRDLLAALPQLERASTPEEWNAAQPIIQAAFGRSMPFDQRGYVLAQARGAAQDGDPFAPDERQRALGITREMNIEAAQSEELAKVHGPAKRGFVWSRDPQGRPYQKQVATPQKPVDPQMQNAIKAFTSQLDSATKMIRGKTYLQNYMGATDEQGRGGWGEVGRAYEDYELAALGVVYAMSGKQTTNKEMERFLRINKPQWNDSDATIVAKSDRLKRVLKAISGGIEKGMEYDQAEGAALGGAARDGRPSPATAPARGADRERGRAIRQMSDDELLKALQQ